MRRAAISLVIGLLLVLAPSPAVASSQYQQVNIEASLIGLTFPSPDPCVVYDVRVDVLKFFYPVQPPQLIFNAAVIDNCSGGAIIGSIGQLNAPQVIPRSAFIVHPALRWAVLKVTVPSFNYLDQTSAAATLRFLWSKPPGSHASDGLASVVGSITRGDLTITLDRTISWNKWGSENFPWAGLWFCAFDEAGSPGCLGQV